MTAAPSGGTVETRGPAETRALARALAARLGPGSVLALEGPLGAGKTCFVQGLGEALGVREPVHSPTFTLINEYRGRCPLYHVDLYRVRDTAEILDLGLAEYLDADGVTVVEWAERAAGLLPARTLRIEIGFGDEPDARCVRIREGAP